LGVVCWLAQQAAFSVISRLVRAPCSPSWTRRSTAATYSRSSSAPSTPPTPARARTRRRCSTPARSRGAARRRARARDLPKHFDRPVLDFLTREDVEALLEAPDRASWSGQRGAVLLAVLYNHHRHRPLARTRGHRHHPPLRRSRPRHERGRAPAPRRTLAQARPLHGIRPAARLPRELGRGTSCTRPIGDGGVRI